VGFLLRGAVMSGSLVVLLVEDDFDVRNVIVEALEMHGMTAVAAASGRQALRRDRARGAAMRAPIALCAAAMLLLSACAAQQGASQALSGSSEPPASAQQQAAITGGVLVGPGAGGMAAAEAFARQICESYRRSASLGGADVANGTTRLAYSCQ
jgi:hypothetical protein